MATREALTRQTIETQLTALTTWIAKSPNAQHTPRDDKDHYQLFLGAATYLTYNASDQPLTGQQAFTLVCHLKADRIQAQYDEQSRSAIVEFLEQFFRGAFTPPAPVLGDTAQIDSLKVDKILGDETSSIMTSTYKIISTGVVKFTLI